MNSRIPGQSSPRTTTRWSGKWHQLDPKPSQFPPKNTTLPTPSQAKKSRNRSSHLSKSNTTQQDQLCLTFLDKNRPKSSIDCRERERGILTRAESRRGFLAGEARLQELLSLFYFPPIRRFFSGFCRFSSSPLCLPVRVVFLEEEEEDGGVGVCVRVLVGLVALLGLGSRHRAPPSAPD